MINSDPIFLNIGKLHVGQRLKLRWATFEPAEGTVTGLARDGAFQVSFDSRDRPRGSRRTRVTYAASSIRGFTISS